MLRLDLHIELPDKEAEDHMGEYIDCDCDDAFMICDDDMFFTSDPKLAGVRFSSTFEVEDLKALGDDYYCSLSFKHRKALREFVVSDEMEKKKRICLAALWKRLDKMVPVQVYWTVQAPTRDADVHEELGQEAYNSVMLSPLEQLASVVDAPESS